MEVNGEDKQSYGNDNHNDNMDWEEKNGSKLTGLPGVIAKTDVFRATKKDSVKEYGAISGAKSKAFVVKASLGLKCRKFHLLQ